MHKLKTKKIQMLRPGQIRVEKSRITSRSDNKGLRGLVESIRANGIIEPIIVRKDENGSFVLVAGLRRLKAASAVGLRRIPCVVYGIDKNEAVLYSVAENLQRSSLDPFVEAGQINRIITNHSFSRNETAIRLGLTLPELTYKLQLLELDFSLTEKLEMHSLGEEYARLLLLLPQFKREQALQEFLYNKLSIDDAAAYVEKELSGKNEEIEKPEPKTDKEASNPVRKHAIGDVRLFANSLAKLTDTLKSAGYNVTSRKNENDKYIEYKVRIRKEQTENGEFKQLKIC